MLTPVFGDGSPGAFKFVEDSRSGRGCDDADFEAFASELLGDGRRAHDQLAAVAVDGVDEHGVFAEQRAERAEELAVDLTFDGVEVVEVDAQQVGRLLGEGVAAAIGEAEQRVGLEEAAEDGVKEDQQESLDGASAERLDFAQESNADDLFVERDFDGLEAGLEAEGGAVERSQGALDVDFEVAVIEARRQRLPAKGEAVVEAGLSQDAVDGDLGDHHVAGGHAPEQWELSGGFAHAARSGVDESLADGGARCHGVVDLRGMGVVKRSGCFLRFVPL